MTPAAPAPSRDAGFPLYSYAFQPIVDRLDGALFAYEALVRGPGGQSAATIFDQLHSSQLHRFDSESRLTALRLAARLGIDSSLTLNVLPQGLDGDHAQLQTLVDAAVEARVATDRVILEITESEAIHDHARFGEIIDDYRGAGFRIAIDDFGAGYAGLNLLADFQPDIVKLDMSLVRDIESRGPRQTIVRALHMVCEDLGIDMIAEGVETIGELSWLEDSGVRLFQGFLLGRPGFECLCPFQAPMR